MIYTSYYSKFNEFDDETYSRYSISNSYPKYIVPDGKIGMLIPKWDIVDAYKKGLINEAKFTELYIAQLESYLDLPSRLVSWDQLNKKQIVLFCWESPDNFCHRKVLAEYVNKKLGYELIREYDRWKT